MPKRNGQWGCQHRKSRNKRKSMPKRSGQWGCGHRKSIKTNNYMNGGKMTEIKLNKLIKVTEMYEEAGRMQFAPPSGH